MTTQSLSVNGNGKPLWWIVGLLTTIVLSAAGHTISSVQRDGERIADGIARTVVRNLKLMARMGVYFEEEVQRRYPEFPTRRGEWSWEDYLPPMSSGLHSLAEAYS